MNKVSKWTWVAIALVVLAVVATALGACGGPTDAQPVACATWQDDQGRWREEDDELADNDPCDLDDLFEDQVRTTAPAKPVPKASPVKPNTRTTRR